MREGIAAVEGAIIAANLARREIENLERFGVYDRLFFEGRSYTNAEELRHARTLARVLHHYGVRRNDRVVVMLPNSPELSSAFQAVWTIGASIIPVISQWTAGEVAHILHSAQPTVALTVPSLASRMEEANALAKTLRKLLVFGESEAAAGEDILDAV